jgi:hypothetical protein
LIGSVVFAGLTIVGANVYIPLMPVPVTLQTLFVLLAGAAIGGRYGTLSQILYVGMGAAGVPVFAGHLGGLSVFADASSPGICLFCRHRIDLRSGRFAPRRDLYLRPFPGSSLGYVAVHPGGDIQDFRRNFDHALLPGAPQPKPLVGC